MKWILGFLSLVFGAFSVYPDREFQSRYPRVESYEIRPGVLATPKYARDGALCEVAIEKRHVHGDLVDLGSTLPRELALQMIDELVPQSERGKATIQLAGTDYIDVMDGQTTVTMANYQNVSIQIFRTRSDSGDVAVIVKWKNACAHPTN